MGEEIWFFGKLWNEVPFCGDYQFAECVWSNIYFRVNEIFSSHLHLKSNSFLSFTFIVNAKQLSDCLEFSPSILRKALDLQPQT